MLRLLALVVLALSVEALAAYCQTSERPARKAPTAVKSPPAPPAVPDPVTWMTKAVDDILSGAIPADPNRPTHDQ